MDAHTKLLSRWKVRDTEYNKELLDKIMVRVARSYTTCQMFFFPPNPPPFQSHQL